MAKKKTRISAVIGYNRCRTSILTLLLAACGIANLSACASPTTRMGTDVETPESANVHKNAWGADSFTFAKRMKIRPPNDFIFYFKHCNLVQRRDTRAYYTQAEYGCTPPP